MRLLLALLLTFTLAGCGDDKSAPQPQPGSPTQPRPEPDRPVDAELAKLPEQILMQVHQDLLLSAKDMQPSQWRFLSGWKLYQSLSARANLPEEALEDALNTRLFLKLHELLHENENQVRAQIDPQFIVKQLLREYFKR